MKNIAPLSSPPTGLFVKRRFRLDFLVRSEDETEDNIINKFHIFAEHRLKTNKIMTQIVLNIDNPNIIPSLRKVLGQIKGVSVAKTVKAEPNKVEKAILKDIEDACREVMEARKSGRELPRFENVLKELNAE